ncbi:MAG TPA: outer membrane beta-barrel protein [Dongiaceae bacterium]|nr:outer membrane beta-barrel protein [Dongiaceae bacterium]
MKIRLMQGLAITALVLCHATPTLAGRSDRGQSTDAYLRLNYLQSSDFDGERGASLETDDDLGIGFGFSYNVDEHWSFGGSIDWGDVDYDAHVPAAAGNLNGPRNYSSSMDVFSINADATYYFFDSDVTPYLVGGLGWTQVDTNIKDGPTESYCWYDPWWGYYCDSYTPTKSLDGLTYRGGVGIRWDVSRYFSIRGSVVEQWLDLDTDLEDLEFTTWRVEFATRM